MTDTYTPLPGSDDEYELVVASSKNMDKVDRLKLRAPCIGRPARQRVAANYGFSEAGEGDIQGALESFGFDVPEDILPPARFWEEVATVLFDGLDEIPEEGVRFDETRRAMGKWLGKGNEKFDQQMKNLGALLGSAENGEALTDLLNG